MQLTAELEQDAQAIVRVLTDLRLFGGLVEIPTKREGKIRFSYDRWHPEQKQFEEDRTGRDVVLKPRQIGFSMLELARDLQFARTHEGTQTVVVVHTSDAKAELFSRVHTMARSLVELGLIPANGAKEDTKTGIRWADNESSIKIIEAGKDEETAKNRGRSGTIHRLHATEVGFYPAPHETMTALLAAAEHGDVVIESTANGTGNWFHEVVQKAREGAFEDFAFHFFPWWQHVAYRADPAAYPGPPSTKRETYWEEKLREVGCNEEQLAWWRKTVSKHTLDDALREYPMGPDEAFTEHADSWLEPEWIDRLRGEVQEPLERRTIRRGEGTHGTLRIYRYPEKGKRYIAYVDPSEGVGRNEAAITVIEHRSAEVAASWHDLRTKPGELGHVAAEIGRFFGRALIAVERNEWRRQGGDGGGKETLVVLERDEHYHNLFRTKDGKLGFTMNGETRPLVFGDLAKAIGDRTASNPDSRTVNQAASLVLGRDNRPHVRSKERGRGDDGLFVSWGGARQVREMVPPPGPLRISMGSDLDSARFHM